MKEFKHILRFFSLAGLVCWFISVVSSAEAQLPYEGDLSITSVEVLQVVENPRLIVADKPAAVRITVMNTFDGTVTVPIAVTYNFGNSTYVDIGPYGGGIPLNQGSNTVYLPGGPAPSVDIEPWLEGPPYLIWDHSGVDDEIEVVIDPDHTITEVNVTNNTITIEKDVIQPISLQVLFVPVELHSNPGSPMVSEEALERQRVFMLNTYPLASLTFTQQSVVERHDVSNYGDDTAYNDFVFDLSTQARLLGYDRVAVLLNHSSFTYGGVALQMLNEPEDRVPVVLNKNDFEAGEFSSALTAHEIGHTFYLWHPHSDWFHLTVYADQKYSVTEREYGALNATFMSYENSPHWNDSDRYQDYPKTWFTTPSDYDYTVAGTYQWNLLDQFKESPIREVLLVACRLKKIGLLDLLPWYLMMGPPDFFFPNNVPFPIPSVNAAQVQTQDDSRNLQIVMLDSNQQQLAILPFRVSFKKLIEPDFGGKLTVVETDTVPFQFTVPFVEGTSFVQIKDESGAVLGQRPVSASAPEVEVLTPNGGEYIIAGSISKICWSGKDQDDDTLKYVLAYSTDGGDSWIPIASDIEGDCYQWNTAGLPYGVKYLIKVIATDGINTGEDISDKPFSIGDQQEPTAVTLASFEAKPGNSTVTLVWKTGDETNNFGFNIYRADSKDGEYIKINSSVIASKVGSGIGTTYDFTDDNVKNRKTYYYKLEDVDVNGVKTMHGPVSATARLLYMFQ